jgi:hypothetical protein
MRLACIVVLGLLLAVPAIAQSPLQGGAPSEQRDERGRITRSESAKERFMRETGYPHGRPGYVVDHIVPRAEGGADDPANMQWQTKEEAKVKDKVECGGHKCGAKPKSGKSPKSGRSRGHLGGGRH